MPPRRRPAAQNPLVALAEQHADARHAILVVQAHDGSIFFSCLPQTENEVIQAGLLAHAQALVTSCEALSPAPMEGGEG
jgi:hypothetical protein